MLFRSLSNPDWIFSMSVCKLSVTDLSSVRWSITSSLVVWFMVLFFDYAAKISTLCNSCQVFLQLFFEYLRNLLIIKKNIFNRSIDNTKEKVYFCGQ